MSDLRTIVANLRRPRLLMRAALHGLDDYRRERDLKRLTGTPLVLGKSAVPELVQVEAELERTRIAGDLSYSIGRHIEVMIALMAETNLLPRPPKTI